MYGVHVRFVQHNEAISHYAKEDTGRYHSCYPLPRMSQSCNIVVTMWLQPCYSLGHRLTGHRQSLSLHDCNNNQLYMYVYKIINIVKSTCTVEHRYKEHLISKHKIRYNHNFIIKELQCNTDITTGCKDRFIITINLL